jgi:hypothetical protein
LPRRPRWQWTERRGRSRGPRLSDPPVEAILSQVLGLAVLGGSLAAPRIHDRSHVQATDPRHSWQEAEPGEPAAPGFAASSSHQGTEVTRAPGQHLAVAAPEEKKSDQAKRPRKSKSEVSKRSRKSQSKSESFRPRRRTVSSLVILARRSASECSHVHMRSGPSGTPTRQRRKGERKRKRSRSRRSSRRRDAQVQHISSHS